MNNTNINHSLNFPSYWKEKKGTISLIRIAFDRAITIIGSDKFKNENRTHFGSKFLMEERLNSFKEISMEEFNILKR
ncbi:MAG: hypothetical protein ACNS60_07300 [Candidatus Cyclobacteriaceae bacterium M2_1C_046]